jgi:hypothetical protein
VDVLFSQNAEVAPHPLLKRFVTLHHHQWISGLIVAVQTDMTLHFVNEQDFTALHEVKNVNEVFTVARPLRKAWRESTAN